MSDRKGWDNLFGSKSVFRFLVSLCSLLVVLFFPSFSLISWNMNFSFYKGFSVFILFFIFWMLVKYFFFGRFSNDFEIQDEVDSEISEC
ncbi:MAG: hypothetical protein V5A68_07680 [Candidatus Thermoplasmatota archaeon]